MKKLAFPGLLPDPGDCTNGTYQCKQLRWCKMSLQSYNMKAFPHTTKLYLAGLFLLALALLVFVQAAFNLNPFLSPSLLNETALLYTLSTLIFLVLLVFGFVLLRTLIKAVWERKHDKPGSKFKTRLLVSMITLTLVPATLLFLFAFGLVNRSIDKWFSAPVDEIF